MANNQVKHLWMIVANNSILGIAVIVLAVLSFLVHFPLSEYPQFVDWGTIITLTGLLILTTGIKESGFFDVLSQQLVAKIQTERLLAFVLVFLSALLAMFLTNDIALFIIVPLTLSMGKLTNNDFLKLVFFEAIGVNVGSTLTPIGNPQNIFLREMWQISFARFVWEMLPLVFLLIFLLSILVICTFQGKAVVANAHASVKKNSKLFIFSGILFLAFLITKELGEAKFLLPFIFLLFLLFYRTVLKKTDWLFLLLFIFVFIDLHLFSSIQPVRTAFNKLNINNSFRLFTAGTLLSQLISNVPSAIFLSKFSSNWKILAFAVNIGGNGTVIASFANLIALRFVDHPHKVLLFSKYSFLFLFISFAAVAIVFF